MINIADRNIRQQELVPPEKLATTRATVVGVGAIGRQVALQLAAIGVPQIQLIDHDTVKVENLAAQSFYENDLDISKVYAVADICRAINSEIQVVTANRKFQSIQFSGGVCFCCVDGIETRRRIFNAVNQRASLFLDARMAAEYLRILTVWDDISKQYFPTTLFPSSEAYRGSCTAKSTIYCANIAAGMMVAQFAKWLRGCDLDKDIDMNLLTNEMGVK
jgi:sulfur carrier protein ThiS adenylyltransferase